MYAIRSYYAALGRRLRVEARGHRRERESVVRVRRRALGHARDDVLPDEQPRALRAVEEGRRHPVAHALRSIPVPADAPTVAVEATRTLPGRGVAATIRRGGRTREFRIVREEGGADP